MTFTKAQQKAHRDFFIEDCYRKAWGAQCNARYIEKELNELAKQYTELKTKDDKLEEEIKALELAVDYHTVENRETRKTKQEERNEHHKKMSELSQRMAIGQREMDNMAATAQINLEMAEFAKDWEWKNKEDKEIENAENNTENAHE